VVIPGVVLAVALFIAYTRPPLVLYGTLAILFIAYLTKEMPVGYAQSDAVSWDSARAGRRRADPGRQPAASCATSPPLAYSGIIAAWCFIFIGVITRAVGLHHPVHAGHQGHVGGDLRSEGRRSVRRHRVLGLVMRS
jgi:ABC-type Fe3+ transport system permease subunit